VTDNQYLQKPEFVAIALALMVKRAGGTATLTHDEIMALGEATISHVIDRDDPDPSKHTITFTVTPAP